MRYKICQVLCLQGFIGKELRAYMYVFFGKLDICDGLGVTRNHCIISISYELIKVSQSPLSFASK